MKKNLKVEEDPLDQDLSGLVREEGFKKMLFEMSPKDTTVTLRVPGSLLGAAKRMAARKGIKYQKLMRQAIAEYVSRPSGTVAAEKPAKYRTGRR